MSLNDRQISLIQSTFLQAIEDIDGVAEAFYNRLFEIAPETRALFHNDMQVQGRKLMQTLLMAVNALNHMEVLLPQVRLLGQQHGDYGVKPADYEPVGAALLWTLKQRLGTQFTPEIEEAWKMLYQVVTAEALSGRDAAQAQPNP
jgi:nitric oxide dioxygenase